MAQGIGRSACVGCEAEFAWEPVVHAGLTYCCEGCSAGGPCTCSYDLAPTSPDAVDHLGLPFRAMPAVAVEPEAPVRVGGVRDARSSRELLAAR